jgi:hypothetical protein
MVKVRHSPPRLLQATARFGFRFISGVSGPARKRRCEKIGACMKARKINLRFAGESEGSVPPPGVAVDFFTPSERAC